MTTEQVIIERNVPAVMRDNVTLYANIYRPAVQQENLPVLLTRLPYNKNLPHFSHRYLDPVRITLAGYIVVIQDVRGRFSSEGDFTPFLQEFRDGYDTVEWAAELEGANGDVGMFGLSYYGFTQLFAAMMRPPSLKVIAPAFTGNDINDTMMHRGGALQTSKLQTWMLESIAPDMLRRQKASEAQIQELLDDLDRLYEDYSFRPLNKWNSITKHGGAINELYQRIISGDLIRELNESQPAFITNCDLPGFHIAGWYDCFLQPTINNYIAMHEQHPHQKLLIGPWGHGVMTAHLGDRYFGIRASGDTINGGEDLTGTHLAWFNQFLKSNVEEVQHDTAPVRLFIMGENRWRDEYEWPLKRTEYTPFYFKADGGLSDSYDMVTSSLQYEYDPDHPVPTIGGGTLFYQGINAGPLEQGTIEERADVLIFETEPLAEGMEVTGPVHVILYAATDAADTDFTAKLTAVDEHGRSIILTEGIQRASHAAPGDSDRQEALAGAVPFEYDIDLWSTSYYFQTGHRLRVEISSSNFPKYAVNLNTGHTVIDSQEDVTACQTVYTGGKYASSITLPVIPR